MTPGQKKCPENPGILKISKFSDLYQMTSEHPDIFGVCLHPFYHQVRCPLIPRFICSFEGRSERFVNCLVCLCKVFHHLHGIGLASLLFHRGQITELFYGPRCAKGQCTNTCGNHSDCIEELSVLLFKQIMQGTKMGPGYSPMVILCF